MTVARELGREDEAKLDDALVVNVVFEARAETTIDPSKPTFVLDWPSAVSPLTRPHADHARNLRSASDLFIGGMEIGPGYTELNDPDIQIGEVHRAASRASCEEEATFRTLDEEFLDALLESACPLQADSAWGWTGSSSF